MATIRWHGTTYAAKPIEQLASGDWLMECQEHGPRFTVGTKIQVKAADIESMDEVEALQSPEQSAAALEQAMADERKTLTPVAELLAKHAAAPSTETPA